MVPVREVGGGIFGNYALVTPNRSRQVIDCKFATAYGIANRTDRIVVANPTLKPILIRMNRQLAELHPRSEADFELFGGRKRDFFGDLHTTPFLATTGGCQLNPPMHPGEEIGEASRTNLDRDPSTSNNINSSYSSGKCGSYSNDIISTNSCNDNYKGNDHEVMVSLADRIHLTEADTIRRSNNQEERMNCEEHMSARRSCEAEQTHLNPAYCSNPPQAMNDDGEPSPEFDWTQFDVEPLKSVDMTELRKQRSPADVEKLAKLLVKYKHLLSDGVLDFNTNVVKHNTTCKISTTVQNPKIVARGQKCTPEEKNEFAKDMAKKIGEGIIEPSFAPWCSNSLLVRKDGKIRMVIDYRALNNVTIKDSYPMPRIQDVTDVLQGSQWFTGTASKHSIKSRWRTKDPRI